MLRIPFEISKDLTPKSTQLFYRVKIKFKVVRKKR